MMIDIDLFRVSTIDILDELANRAKTGKRVEYSEYSDNELYAFVTKRMAPYNKTMKHI